MQLYFQIQQVKIHQPSLSFPSLQHDRGEKAVAVCDFREALKDVVAELKQEVSREDFCFIPRERKSPGITQNTTLGMFSTKQQRGNKVRCSKKTTICIIPPLSNARLCGIHHKNLI